MLGRYLGSAIDVGLEMTDNIMKANGKVIHRSTLYFIKGGEKSNQSHVSLRKQLNYSIRDRFGPDILPDKFPYVNF